MKYQLEDRIFINEAGNQVKYKRVVVTGYLNGNLEQIELPISKDQAILYRAMESGSEPEITRRNGGEVDKERKSANTNNESTNWLD